MRRLGGGGAPKVQWIDLVALASAPGAPSTGARIYFLTGENIKTKGTDGNPASIGADGAGKSGVTDLYVKNNNVGANG